MRVQVQTGFNQTHSPSRWHRSQRCWTPAGTWIWSVAAAAPGVGFEGRHCLNDLLYRQRAGQVPIQIAKIMSNHPDLEGMASFYGVPFENHVVLPHTKPDFEAEVLKAVREYDIELVVLARFMQILSPELCDALAGRAINIHHSFLPGFKGANPYRQAHTRGVKLIGATAHFVTPDLDEGPIIEQNVRRVDHTKTVAELVAMGQEQESRTLTEAVRLFAERRVFLDGHRTVVFD